MRYLLTYGTTDIKKENDNQKYHQFNKKTI